MDTRDTNLLSKLVIQREGSALYTADELAELYVQDACGLLDVNPQVEQYCPEDRSQALSDACLEYEHKLENIGYSTYWNDGYGIYKDLTAEEIEYLND